MNTPKEPAHGSECSYAAQIGKCCDCGQTERYARLLREALEDAHARLKRTELILATALKEIQ